MVSTIQLLRSHFSLTTAQADSRPWHHPWCCLIRKATCMSCKVVESSTHISKESLWCQARSPWEDNYEAGEMKPKVQWRLQEDWDPQNIEHWLTKAFLLSGVKLRQKPWVLEACNQWDHTGGVMQALWSSDPYHHVPGYQTWSYTRNAALVSLWFNYFLSSFPS